MTNSRTRVAVVRQNFSPLTCIPEAVLAQLAADRAERLDCASVTIVAMWSQGGRMLLRTSTFFQVASSHTPIAVSLGRHTACHIGGIGGAALRHALLLLWPGVGSRPARMEAIDLKTGIGLSVGAAAPANHIEGAGIVRFGVGEAEVLVVPCQANEALAWPDVEGARPSHRPRWAARREVSDVVVALNDLRFVRTGIFSHREASRASAATAPQAERVDLCVTADALADGVLLGRYERCVWSTQFARHNGVSRVHCLVWSRGGQTFVADVGSTNGTHIAVGDRKLPAHLVHVLEEHERLFVANVEVVVHVAGLEHNVRGCGEA